MMMLMGAIKSGQSLEDSVCNQRKDRSQRKHTRREGRRTSRVWESGHFDTGFCRKACHTCHGAVATKLDNLHPKL